MHETQMLEKATQVINKIKENGHTLGLAESCTGGWLSKIITDVSGVSAVYKGGICSYSNEVKMNLLGVQADTLAQYGAVSEQTARQMAAGVKETLNTDIGVGIKDTEGWSMIMPCALVNGYEGYFPMKSAYDEGGYEARSSTLKPGGDNIIVDGMCALLNEIK